MSSADDTLGRGYYERTAVGFGWGPGVERVPEARARFLESHAEGRMLDVGCGPGATVGHLASRGHDAAGVDFVPAFVEHARAHHEGEFHVGDALALPFEDGAFDTAMAFDVLEHLDDAAVLGELVRVSKARVLVSVPARTPPELREAGVVLGHHEDRSHLRTYDEADLAALLERGGLRVRAIETADPVNLRLLARRGVRLGGGLRERLFFRWLRGAEVAAWPATLLAAAER